MGFPSSASRLSRPREHARLEGLPAGDCREALLDDVALVTEILQELVDCPLAGVRTTRVRRAMCPRWHVDRVPLRMLCTYQGPGTEWLDDQGVDRRTRLKDAGIESSACRRADVGELVLLKGALWQDNAGPWRGAPLARRVGGHRVAHP